MSSLASLPALAAAEEHLRELPIPPWAFGAISIGVFVALLGVLWSFRNTAAKTGQHDHGAHH
jgi:heme/copper-type cytochrome/quinol oxidase subunit 2